VELEVEEVFSRSLVGRAYYLALVSVTQKPTSTSNSTLQDLFEFEFHLTQSITDLEVFRTSDFALHSQ
jgi:hypothetical protein